MEDQNQLNSETGDITSQLPVGFREKFGVRLVRLKRDIPETPLRAGFVGAARGGNGRLCHIEFTLPGDEVTSYLIDRSLIEEVRLSDMARSLAPRSAVE